MLPQYATSHFTNIGRLDHEIKICINLGEFDPRSFLGKYDGYFLCTVCVLSC